MASRKVAVIVGSLRKESYNRKVAKTLMLLAGPELDMEIVEIGQLALYNQDDDANPPPAYNRSVPGVLKNAIDVGSRPYGHSAWNGKPAGVISVSPGAVGGFGANHHLRQMLVFLNMPAMTQPEAYVGGIATMFEGDRLTNDSTRAFLQTFIDAFAAWVERHAD